MDGAEQRAPVAAADAPSRTVETDPGPGADAPEPPPAPSIRRRVAVPRGQATGQLAIILVVFLAVLGVFGEAQGAARAEVGALSVEIEYPSLVRYGTQGLLEVSIRVGDEPVDDLWVAISSDYLDAFSGATFLPEARLAAGGSTLIPVGDVAADGNRVVTAELQAERYWLHGGWVEIRAGAQAIARLRLSTFVLP